MHACMIQIKQLRVRGDDARVFSITGYESQPFTDVS